MEQVLELVNSVGPSGVRHFSQNWEVLIKIQTANKQLEDVEVEQAWVVKIRPQYPWGVSLLEAMLLEPHIRGAHPSTPQSARLLRLLSLGTLVSLCCVIGSSCCGWGYWVTTFCGNSLLDQKCVLLQVILLMAVLGVEPGFHSSSLECFIFRKGFEVVMLPLQRCSPLQPPKRPTSKGFFLILLNQEIN